MSDVVLLYRYKSLLSSRRAVSAGDSMAVSEVSLAMVKRYLAKPRDLLHALIVYGTRACTPKYRATLKRARWVAGHVSHANKRSATRADGSSVLEIECSDERELTGDLLRLGDDVKVLTPPGLPNITERALQEAVGGYV